jgi:hypothetical protein
MKKNKNNTNELKQNKKTTKEKIAFKEKVRKFFDIKDADKKDVAVYLILRTLVIIVMIRQILLGEWNNVFLCVLTLILFMIPAFIEKRINIELPNALQIIILLFIFSAEILGEINEYYLTIKHWDTILHTINGFLCAAIGFSLIDILNQKEFVYVTLSPIFVALVAFSFSMTIGVCWEFFEYGMDTFLKKDMQKDTIVTTISTVNLEPNGKNIPVVVKDITSTTIHTTENGEEKDIEIDGGYLDIGLNDTMKDLLVNFIGAFVFSIIGLLYIEDRDKYKFAENFIPVMKKKTK